MQHGQHATCGKKFSLGQPAFGRTWPAPSDPSELARLRPRGGTHRRSSLVCPGVFGALPAAKQHAPSPPSHRAAHRPRPRAGTGPPKMHLRRVRCSSLLLPPNGRCNCPASFAGSAASPARPPASPGSLAVLVTAAGLASSPRPSQGGSPARPCSALPRTARRMARCTEGRCEAQVAQLVGAMAEFGRGLSTDGARPT